MRRPSGIVLTLALLLALSAGRAWPSPEGEAPADAPEAPIPPTVIGEIALTPGSHLIPWERLDEASFQLTREVVGQALVFRHVDGIAFRSRKEVFDFLLEHPDFAADLARALREGKYRVRRTADGFEADDGRGARGLLKPLYAEGDRRVFYLEGRWDPPLLPSIVGRLVLVMDTAYTEAPDGEHYAEMRVAGYLRVDNALAEVLVAVARGLSEVAVERKVRRFFRHVARVSQRAYDDPEGLAEEITRHPDLAVHRVAEFRRVLLARRLPPWAEAIPFRFGTDALSIEPGDLFEGD